MSEEGGSVLPVHAADIVTSLAAFRAAAAAWFISAGLRILLILAGAALLIRVSYVAIHRIEVVVDDGDPHLSEREKRARTMAAILRKATAFLVSAIAAVTILDVLGVRTGAILTAAGIGGVAVGLGAQNLVRDLIAGFFFLLEDQIRVGDVVTINERTGVVEDMTLRIIVLRDFNGTAHIFPNGAVQFVSNQTKDWSRAVVDVPVAYGADVDQVAHLMRQVGEELAADPDWRSFIVEPPQVLGVTAFTQLGMTMRMAVTTKSQKHIEVERELRRRLMRRFAEAGIEVPSLYHPAGGQPGKAGGALS